MPISVDQPTTVDSSTPQTVNADDALATPPPLQPPRQPTPPPFESPGKFAANDDDVEYVTDWRVVTAFGALAVTILTVAIVAFLWQSPEDMSASNDRSKATNATVPQRETSAATAPSAAGHPSVVEIEPGVPTSFEVESEESISVVPEPPTGVWEPTGPSAPLVASGSGDVSTAVDLPTASVTAEPIEVKMIGPVRKPGRPAKEFFDVPSTEEDFRRRLAGNSTYLDFQSFTDESLRVVERRVSSPEHRRAAKAAEKERLRRLARQRRSGRSRGEIAGLPDRVPSLGFPDNDRARNSELPANHRHEADDSLFGDKERLALLASRPDVAGLPLQMGDDCRKTGDDLHGMARAVRSINSLFAPGRRFQARLNASDPLSNERRMKLAERLQLAQSQAMRRIRNSREWVKPEAVSSLVQMLQVQPASLRTELVGTLSEIDSVEAGVALAERAIFDPDENIRADAVEALQTRPPSHYQDRLLEGLRYPWTPVAFYASEALIALEEEDVVPRLVELLEQPDPAAPYVDDQGDLAKRELVRVNHLRNCLLCHAPSEDRHDLVRGVVPTPGKAIPVAYYGTPSGYAVRADIVYLRQDFSVMHRVPSAEPWPEEQRFDYFVRERKLTKAEVAAFDAADQRRKRHEMSHGTTLPDYPQRRVVLRSLRELTGRDLGETSTAWRRWLARRERRS